MPFYSWYTRLSSHLEVNPGGFRRYIQNTGWLLFARIATLVVAFFTTIYVIRYLGPENYGKLSYTVSFVSLFSFISTLGVDQIVYRELVKRPEDEAAILGSGFVLKFIGGFVAMILAIGSAWLMSADQIELILISLISVTLFGASWQIITLSFQAKVESKYPSMVTLCVALILAVAKILVIYFDKGIIYFAAVLVLESVLYAVFYVVIYQIRTRLLFAWRASRSMMLSLLRDGWPLMLATVSAILYARIDQVMLRHYIDIEAVGIYDAAVRLSDVWYIIPGVILATIFPAIISAREASTELFRRRVWMCAILLVALSACIILPTLWLAPSIISILYGSAFAGSAAVLTIYIWSLIGYSLGQLANTYLVAENYIYIYLFTSVTTVAINIVLNMVLIPTYGLSGAAWATLVSYTLIPIVPLAFRKVRVQLLPNRQRHI